MSNDHDIFSRRDSAARHPMMAGDWRVPAILENINGGGNRISNVH